MSFAGEIREVDDVAAAFADLVAERAPPSIALSGGSTAEEAYAALANRKVDWSRPRCSSATSATCPSTTRTRTRG